MGWSQANAADAYLHTLKLCSNTQEKENVASTSVKPESNEFISALAAGINAKLILEVTPEASQSTVALAAAARTTGGRLVCILLEEQSLVALEEVLHQYGLKDIVEFKVGDPLELLPEFKNIDFSLVDCKFDSYRDLLKLLDVNPERSVVVASNLEGGKEGLCGNLRGLSKHRVRSMKHLIGEGMEVTIVGKSFDELGITQRRGSDEEMMMKTRMGGSARKRPRTRSEWIKRFDRESGEEHIFRMPRSL